MQAIELITYKQLLDLEERLYNKIQILLEDQKKSKKFIRTKELKERLGGVSDSLVTKLRIKGLLPYTKFGGMYLYDWEKIENNILSNQINEGGNK
jgi:Mn-dependent DtxR family transcriptional regulator